MTVTVQAGTTQPDSSLVFTSATSLCIDCALRANVAGNWSADGKTMYLANDASPSDKAAAAAFFATPPAECAHPDPVRVQCSQAYIFALHQFNTIPPLPVSGTDPWATTRAKFQAAVDAAWAALQAAGGPV